MTVNDADGGMRGRVDTSGWYETADNDANFNSALNSNDAAYFENYVETEEEKRDRWKLGGGIQDELGRGNKLGGKSRDADGTIDRVRDPPKELLPTLFAVKMQSEAYNVDLIGTFMDAGGSGFGTIPTTKFSSALVVALNRFPLTEAVLLDIITAYGCGEPAPAGSAKARLHPFEAVAWKDFCEDVEKAEDVAGVSGQYPGGPPPWSASK